jgi:23S rRNA (uracil1939-C5)-methyltransferase
MAPRAGEVLEVIVARLGGRGDGIAMVGGQPLFVPLALPGDRLRIRVVGRRGEGLAGAVVERLAEAPRAIPPCPHFGRCGGCRLQHLPAGAYQAWQRQQVGDALARRGLAEVPVEPLLRTPPASRRRVRLAFARAGGSLRLGFRERAGRRVVDIAVCPVARPEIVALLAPLRELVAGLEAAGREGEVLVTLAETGADVLVMGAGPPTLADRERLAGFAETEDLARLAWQEGNGAAPEPVVQRRPVRVRFDGIGLDLPAGAFLQASDAAEAAIRGAVRAAIGEARVVADLFAGCGPLALPLAGDGRRVLAVEVEPTMLAALAAAARAAGLAGRIETAARDLERRPLPPSELARFDAVVLDPPRAGARAQADALAASPVPRAAMVSCQPTTLARDLRILVDGGWQVAWVRPIDAFLWSGRIELVAALRRAS